MLSRKQKAEVDTKVTNYYHGMRKTHKAPAHLLDAWARRYRVTLEQQIQKQHKR